MAIGGAAVLGSLADIAVTTAVYDVMREIEARFLTSIALSVLGSGLLVGLCQWLVLRRHVARAGWWVPASGLSLIVGWFMGGFVASIVVGSLNDLATWKLVSWLLSAIIYGAATGLALTRLLRSRTPTAC